MKSTLSIGLVGSILLFSSLMGETGRAEERTTYAWKPFQPVQRPSPRVMMDSTRSQNPIDAFITAEHEARKLKPRPEADKHVLLRRVYLDLIGLPPTPEESQRFLEDRSPDAFEKVVDRLLADPRYGERWGRHWMDVWRYSDWAGYATEVRESHKHIWRWRDWIVDSLNADKGYDRMVQEMLAGDELAPEDQDVLRASGFLVRNWYLFNRNVWLQNAVEHTSKAFLGVTINCARCHDHFFDPISQAEYYQFRAFFEPHQVRIDRVPGQTDVQKDGMARVYDGAITPTYLFTRGDESKPEKARAFDPAVPQLFGKPNLEIKAIDLPRGAYAPHRRGFVIEESRAASAAGVKTAQSANESARQTAIAAASILTDHPLRRLVVVSATRRTFDAFELSATQFEAAQAAHKALEAVLEVEQLEDTGKKDGEEWKQAATKALQAQREQTFQESRRNVALARQTLTAATEKTRADATKKLDDAEKALKTAEANLKQPAGTNYTRRTSTGFPTTSSGRRLALARWITDRNNPLAARVAVNQVWMRHFGKPLVASVFDFGKNGQAPTHPTLLDWLAAEFMDSEWSMKRLHKTIVTSMAYRLDSNHDGENAAIDPENRYVWKMNARRLEAEIVRDSVLHVSGRLNTTMHGPEIDQNQGLVVPRRSIYFRHAHEKQMEFLVVFDNANVVECYQRSESVIPQQALALANSSLTTSQSRLLGRALSQEAGPQPTEENNARFVRSGFQRLLSRQPTAEELSECLKFLQAQTALFADKTKLTPYGAASNAPVAPSAEPHLRAREDLIHVLMNHHEFVTIR